MGTWTSVAIPTAHAAAASVLVASTLLMLYAGMAVTVALFHPDRRRRRDARIVLKHLTEFLPTIRRGPTSVTDQARESPSRDQ